MPKLQPDTFVVIDWAMAGLAAAGDDLGQLLIGHAHDGVLAVDDLAALYELLVQAYLAGLADEDCRIDEDVVRAGMDTGLSVRSAFTALPLERLADPITEDLRSVFAGRIELTRYLVDLGLQVDLGRVPVVSRLNQGSVGTALPAGYPVTDLDVSCLTAKSSQPPGTPLSCW